jgi:hypothetical protein
MELDAVEGERLGIVVDDASPPDPGTPGVAQHWQQGADEPAGARRPRAICRAHHRQSVGGDHEWSGRGDRGR